MVDILDFVGQLSGQATTQLCSSPKKVATATTQRHACNGLNRGLFKRQVRSVNMTLFEKRSICKDNSVMALEMSSSRLSVRAFNPTISVLIGGKQREKRGRRCRDQSHAAIRNAAGPWKLGEASRGSPLEPAEEVQPCCCLDFGPVAAKTMEE